MLLREFYLTIAASDESATSFLREKGVLQEQHLCEKCDGPMRLANKKSRGQERMVWRCKRKGCQATKSTRTGNKFFAYTDLNGKLNSSLSLYQILELVYLWTLGMGVETVQSITGRSKPTIVDWFNYCREVCSAIVSVDKRGQMKGTDFSPVQIDEARFAGRRKYNRGRMLDGDHAPEEEDEDEIAENNRNHGRRIDGPWVFGLIQGRDVRYFYVEKRNAETLIPIIQREVEVGSVIHSDEWAAYRQLQQVGFHHATVNHQHHYVDSATGVHTQKIERSWLESKIDILKKKRGVPFHHFQGHLDEYCWRYSKGPDGDLFLCILQDIREIFV
ncbi:uncharacterized protein LOC143019698 [Oratosquilla oratoria]|uniref:uncharacterized protein LOC143019698 n=1 Tax=Oratosquilla oratoria TaxID=337810 RepID=UPI003F7706ED